MSNHIDILLAEPYYSSRNIDKIKRKKQHFLFLCIPQIDEFTKKGYNKSVETQTVTTDTWKNYFCIGQPTNTHSEPSVAADG